MVQSSSESVAKPVGTRCKDIEPVFPKEIFVVGLASHGVRLLFHDVGYKPHAVEQIMQKGDVAVFT